MSYSLSRRQATISRFRCDIRGKWPAHVRRGFKQKLLFLQRSHVEIHVQVQHVFMHKFCLIMWSLPNSSHLSSAYVRNFPDKKTSMFSCLMSQQAEVATTTTTAQTRHVNRKQISSAKKPEHISTSPASRRASLVIIAPWIRSNTKKNKSVR